MFKQLDVVRLKENDVETGVKTSFIGTIVDVLTENVFTVEFFDDDGYTIEPSLWKLYYADQLIKV